MQTNKNQIWFVYSTRFLAALVVSIATMIGPDGVPTGVEVYNGLMILSGAFVLLRTAHNLEDIKRDANKPIIPMIDGEI